ncbi:hypothetical protein JCM19238_460 [Vibrio ponticus]|nr:hypothetical protein JCM19238_460 [Vibrio ponticus]
MLLGFRQRACFFTSKLKVYSPLGGFLLFLQNVIDANSWARNAGCTIFIE